MYMNRLLKRVLTFAGISILACGVFSVAAMATAMSSPRTDREHIAMMDVQRPGEISRAGLVAALPHAVYHSANSPVARGASTSKAPAQPASGSPSAPRCGKVIDVNLTTQRLDASECGHAFISTPITSGRPGLRTPTGNFTIFFKERDVYFYSPWPSGDPNYYPPMFVAYAMEFLDGGYFLHTDPDEPAAAFGPGSQNGPFASHGCVHVPYSAMVALFGWADGGTTVTVHY